MSKNPYSERTLEHFLSGKSEYALELFRHFTEQFITIGSISLMPAKSMIGIATSRKRIAYITQFGKTFIHVVFPFTQPYPDNLCFQKIAQVPDDDKQFNHHFRMYFKEDVNEEVREFMQIAYQSGS